MFSCPITSTIQLSISPMNRTPSMNFPLVSLSHMALMRLVMVASAASMLSFFPAFLPTWSVSLRASVLLISFISLSRISVAISLRYSSSWELH